MKILPSSFYESLAGTEGYKINVVCMGVRRSATTMIYQIMCDTFPEGGVVKTHSFLDVPPDVPVICTYRHFLDCAVSWWRVMRGEHAKRNALEIGTKLNPDEPQTVEYDRAARNRLTVEAAIDAAVLVKRDILHLELYHIAHRIRYEARVNLDQRLTTWSGRSITAEAVAQHSLEGNRTLKRFTAEPLAELGPDDPPHCHEGRSVWREYLTNDTKAAMLSVLESDLKAYGYDYD